ncbi:GDSL esterase/lipase At5g03980-like [Phragmites australis]|uniref:GDSL esterase/lipase At5g03980-like n=1 Tax=Phragmites australis TaxID=29695 RepID=UPI002D76C146|nr:GDSL esterase/lipase At5g03980-like [Phragmites australis]
MAMAGSHAKLSCAVLLSLLLLLRTPAGSEAACSVDAIYSFGDSIADTGNLLRQGSAGFFASIGSYPYGQTLRKPTGRCSDGLLIIDYFAMALNLSLVSPYLDKGADFASGVNFAVAGATALDRGALLQSGVMMPPASVPLTSQLDWFKSHLNATCPSQEDCAKKLAGALFLVGEIGGNDYNYAFFQGIRSIEAMKAYVPQVVKTIMDVSKEVIELGATKIIIPGNFPIGCSPSYLSLFSASGTADHDGRGCLKSYNAFAAHHNEQLQAAIDDLRKVNTDVSIVYADYYGAFMHLLDHASILGFDDGSLLLQACCGAGGAYNYDMNMMCGTPGTSSCANPARRVSWDGIHLTQQAYRAMALSLIMEGFAQPADAVQEIWSC